MAPLTRSRAPGNVPNEKMAEYYRLRASAGLIVAEGTSPSPNGLGYPRIPGCYSQPQGRGWKAVTDAVHKDGGRIFLQLMHTGRVTHALNLPQGARVLAPSAVTCPGEMWTDQTGMQPFTPPKEMTLAEIKEAVAEYASAAKIADDAGFDGVELHGANGYLIDQFFNTASNKRTDQYGGSAENRIRFALEVADATVKAIGASKVGIRVSPYGAFNGMAAYPGIEETYGLLAEKLSSMGLVYMHLVDHSSMGAPPVSDSVKRLIRSNFKQSIILSGGYDAKRAQHDLEEQRGDLVAFGRPFISNPHLVQKMKTGTPLTPPNPALFYTPGDAGYLDYPID
jgi:N-ethylmaleimide reductase